MLSYDKFISKVLVHASNLVSNLKPSNKETPHSIKGQQLENKLLYRFVTYMSFLEKSLSYNLTLSFPKVQLLKSHFCGQIILNRSQFRVSCYKSDVKLKLRFFPKPYVNYKTIQQFIFKLLALKRVRSFFFCGV